MEITKKKVIIIGGGPAGAAAAMQLTRYGVRPLILERHEIGGLLWNANLVENYPGFPNGVSGQKLIGLIKAQMNRIGVEVEREEVTHVDWQEDTFTVATSSAVYQCAQLVVASGTTPKPLPGVVQPGAMGRVFSEVWPLRDVRECAVAIVGAGDAAFDYALNLSKNRNFVTILNRGDSVKCLGLLFERASRESRIAYRTGVAVREVKVGEDATRLEVRCESKGGGEESLHVDYVLFAIGRDPNLGFLSDEVRRREMELIEDGRLYFAGDVKNELFRQVAIAAGDGLRVAMQIYSRMQT